MSTTNPTTLANGLKRALGHVNAGKPELAEGVLKSLGYVKQDNNSVNSQLRVSNRN